MAEPKIAYVLAIYHPTTEKIVTTIELNDRQVDAIKGILSLTKDHEVDMEYEVSNVFFSAVAG